MRSLIAILAAALIAPIAANAAPPIQSGSYNDAMLIGYDPATGVVSGYFDMQQGGTPSFSCVFYLSGKLAGGKAAIATYFPKSPKGDLIKGVLALTDSTHFSIGLADEHGGCGNLEPFAQTGDPATFDLATAHAWTSVAVVKSARAYFYASPGAAAHGKAYVVEGDGLGVRASKPGWLQVDYVDGAKPITGWLPTSDVFSPLP